MPEGYLGRLTVMGFFFMAVGVVFAVALAAQADWSGVGFTALFFGGLSAASFLMRLLIGLLVSSISERSRRRQFERRWRRT